jgi:transporter family protein
MCGSPSDPHQPQDVHVARREPGFFARIGVVIGDEGHAMKSILLSWQFWALLSAAFAALTAIFAKVGIDGINPDFATFVRTVVILVLLGGILLATGQWQAPASISGRASVFLILSGLATGASWLCYFRALKLGDAARVAPLDKLSVVLVAVFGVLFLGERLATPNWIGIALIASGAVLVAYRA